MKISAMPAGGATPVNPNEGMSASPDRMARAKAIAAGQSPQERTSFVDPQIERTQSSIKKIRMRTQVSPDRHTREEQPVEVAAEAQALPPETAETGTLENIEPATTTSDATKPLSPQFAALAKAKREMQLERQKLDADKAAFTTSQTQDLSGYVAKADLKANALKVLLAEGVTYDQLTEEILASNQESTDVSALRAELKALKEGFDNQNKSLTDRDAATEAQVKAQIRRTVDQLVAQGDDFEMIREAGYAPQVVDLIDKVWKREGILLDETEAAATIEKELLEESLKFARIKKVQSMLNPAQSPQKTQSAQPQDRPGVKVMRTLTNRDGSTSVSMSKRERAIAAMEGRLKS